MGRLRKPVPKNGKGVGRFTGNPWRDYDLENYQHPYFIGVLWVGGLLLGVVGAPPPISQLATFAT